MAEFEKLIVFLCSSTLKKGNSKLSYRIAEHLAEMGLATIGSLEELSLQRSVTPEAQRDMIFLNDCRSGCVNVLTHGFEKGKYVYVDMAKHAHIESFDVATYVSLDLIPQLEASLNRTLH